jgi:hypothetical protein
MKIKSTQKKETPPEFKGRFNEDGTGFDFGSYTKRSLKDYMKKNPNMPFELVPLLPESKDQRGFFEGAICPLVAFYQERMNHHDSKDVKKVREWLKIEFNGEMVEISGKVNKIAASTKNKLNQGFLERVEGYLIDNYAPPKEVFDTKKYDHWKDTIFPYGGPDNYLDYLIEVGILK